MNVEVINPFIDATRNAFSSMLMTSVTPGALKIRTQEKPEGPTADICSVIGMSGTAKGSVKLGFSSKVAKALVGQFVGDPGAGESMSLEEIGDGVGELVNLIAGGAKATLASQIHGDISISVPTVFSGDALKSRPEKFPVLVVPFESELGAFHMEIAIEVNLK